MDERKTWTILLGCSVCDGILNLILDMYSKFFKLIEKIIEGLENGKLVAEKDGVEIENYKINAEDTSLVGEYALYIRSCNWGESIIIVTSDYPELKQPVKNLRDAIEAARIRNIEEKVVTPILNILEKL